ncbi:NAD binding domain of 6-phosphogluconate dehydrogenase-domain-containing protein [Myxozyma melibiosi]|uniref:NAD binding domain of 6-phosphogluconate dehydrogenase-domain-containing protein n=1 Tax=Myxozyma melibiosi TaxID=54550 RepID=A0ABR1F844_9ASCO
MVNALPTIGFCGLGAMGGGMACNLAKEGFPIQGFDVYPPSMDKLVAAGGTSSKSPAEAAKGKEFLILMVVNDKQADSVLFDGGAIEAMDKGKTVMLCSTVPPVYLKTLREHIDSVGRSDLKLLDCPVSGGSIRAAAGTLSIFSSGPDEDLDHADVVLKAMSDPLYRIKGGISMGQVAKMCHQHQAATNIIMASEAMGLAAAVGLNTQEVYDKVCKSIGRSWMFENRGPHMLANDYHTVHSATTIILKDATIVTNHAKSAFFPLPLENMAEQLYIQGCHAGFAKDDDAGLCRMFMPSPTLVGELTTSAATTEGKYGVTVDDIINLMAGVELASTRECMAFAKFVGLDLELLLDIINKGAGASNTYEKTASAMVKAGLVNFKPIADAAEIRDKLEASIKKTEAFHQYLPMSSAALQELNYYL